MKGKKTIKEIIVILDNIRSTYNVGAIFRSADVAVAFGIVIY